MDKSVAGSIRESLLNVLQPTKIYCEDDYFEEESTRFYRRKCDLTIQEPPPPPVFNYFRFSEYLRVKMDIESANRMVEASKGVVSLGLDHYNDEELEDELFGIYGEMDRSSERYRLIFKNYKIQRLEQIEEWIRMEKSVMGREDFEEVPQYLDEKEELLKRFSPEEISQFDSVSEKTGYQPFVLPRVIEVKDISGKKGKGKQSNLKYAEGLAISSVKETLQECPLGLALELLVRKCEVKLDKVGYCGGPPVSIELLKRAPFKELYFTESYDDFILAFPSKLKPYLAKDPAQILWHVKHKLAAILNLSYGIVEVKECVQLLDRIFQIKKFHWQHWGFATEVDFVRTLFTRWISRQVKVIELDVNNNKRKQYYLAVITESAQKLIENRLCSEEQIKPVEEQAQHSKKKGNKNVRPPTCSPAMASSSQGPSLTSSSQGPSLTSSSSSVAFPWNNKKELMEPSKPPNCTFDVTATTINPKYVQMGEQIHREQNEIKPGARAQCVVSWVQSPTQFYLVRQVKWKYLERLFRELRSYWISNPAELPPHPNFLQNNFICMAKIHSEEEEEVYRVVILGKPDQNHYRVYCFDYGNFQVVRHHQLRYLPKEYLHVLEAQAIPCALYNVASAEKHPKTGEDVWSRDVCNFAEEIFCPNENDLPIVTVSFRQKVQVNGKWLVKASSPSNSLDMGEQIMRFIDGHGGKPQ